MFIAVDGIDGAGKTTLVRQLAESIVPAPIVTKEPTDNSKWGRILRESSVKGRLSKEDELEFFHLDRMAHIRDLIRPITKNGGTVISDRYVDSTLAFQALDTDEADRLYQRFLPEIMVPDVTFILDCPVDVGLQRIASRNAARSVFETRQFLERAREIYFSRKGPNYKIIDASGSAQNTFRQAIRYLKEIAENHSDVTFSEVTIQTNSEEYPSQACI